MKRYNNKHRKALEKLASSFGELGETFGFKDVISVSIEKNLYDEGRQIAQTDLIFELKGGHVHLFEYKGNGNGEATERAKEQLETAVWWYSRYRPDVPHDHIHTHIISGDDPKYKHLLK